MGLSLRSANLDQEVGSYGTVSWSDKVDEYLWVCEEKKSWQSRAVGMIVLSKTTT